MLFLGRLAFNVFNRVFDRGDLLGIFVRDFQLEGFFKSHYEFDDIKRIGAQVVHEGRVAVHLALIDAQLLDNNLLHLLLNCHDSSWDFVNALILAAFAEFPQVAASCPTPHSAISSRILPERLAATLASWGSLVSCARPGGYPFTGATGALGNPRAGCRPAPRTHFTMRFPKTDDTLAAGESGLEPADGRERYVRSSSARKGTRFEPINYPPPTAQ